MALICKYNCINKKNQTFSRKKSNSLSQGSLFEHARVIPLQLETSILLIFCRSEIKRAEIAENPNNNTETSSKVKLILEI